MVAPFTTSMVMDTSNVHVVTSSSSGVHRFRDQVFHVDLLLIESLDVDNISRRVVSGLLEKGKMRIVFSSPTLLRDPFKAEKYKSLIPTSMNIFSTPVYVNLYLSGRLKQRVFAKTLILLHRLLNEPCSVYKTVKVIKMRYDESKNPIPALFGYVNLFLGQAYYEQYSREGLNLEEILHETLVTALTIGVETLRATGFGHITASAPPGSSATTPTFRRHNENI